MNIVNTKAGLRLVQGEGIASGRTEFLSAGDLNDDGINDYLVIYPDGSRQELYFF